mmetsp:Transcript_30448/g.72452  ORF Transcript_30448/g.72452 Transcript_30448/m.72452 type:complete len:898 (+) Transcript_30448:202-2895(+)
MLASIHRCCCVHSISSLTRLPYSALERQRHLELRFPLHLVCSTRRVTPALDLFSRRQLANKPAATNGFDRNSVDEDDIYSSSTSLYNYSVERSLRQISRTLQPADYRRPRELKGLRDYWGRLAYKYYNWRSGTGNDILFVLTVVAAAVLGLGVANYVLSDGDRGGVRSFWSSIYEVAQLFFQNGFPDPSPEAAVQQIYAVSVATAGLVFFTILLAMVEQLFLEVLETNVERGSPVYERGHVLVLSWMESALSLNGVWEVMHQICQFHKPTGGTVIVVLCDESKLRMESLFARYIPEKRRYGTKFVFRQGSPLLPDNLRIVAAKDAGTTVIVSDASIAPNEADAQSIRAAVLIDELYAKGEPRGNVVVELKAGISAQLLRNACSEFVIPISTYNMNSIRLARLVMRPITAHVTNRMLDFGSNSQHYIHHFPELVGKRFRDLKYYFPDATVLGIINTGEGRCRWQPHDAVVQPGDELDILRDGSIPHHEFRPKLVQPMPDTSSEFVDVVAGSIDDCLACLETQVAADASLYELYRRGEEAEAADSDVTEKSLEDLLRKVADIPSELASSMSENALAELITSKDEIEDAADGMLLEASGNGGGDEQTAEEGAAAEAEKAAEEVTDAEKEEWQLIGSEEEKRMQQTDKPRVLIVGAAEDQFMCETIQEMDKGLAALPPGSHITLFSKHVPRSHGHGLDDLFPGTEKLQRVSVTYIMGDPLSSQELAKLPLETFGTIIIVCDKGWLDPDVDANNGIDARDTADMLRMDAMLMTVQITIRMLLSRRGCKNVRIITEKVAFQGNTRFDDPERLPLGFMFNRKDFAARLLSQVACQPKLLAVIAAGAQGTNYEMRDPNIFLAPGETLNYWGLMERVEDYGEHLLGYVEHPKGNERSLDVVMNPKV